MFESLAEFHFIRPLWFLAILPLLFILWALRRISLNQSGWNKVIPQHLAKVLVGADNSIKKASVWRPLVIGLLSIIALAGPTWEKRPQPVFQLSKGAVILLDLSYSMLSTDIKPNRLTLARFKAIDLLDTINEGEIGLIAYAGDAFSISPLTDDINNIKLLLPSLTPEIMPELGSYPIAAFEQAHTMLNNAGHTNGTIYWFTDGIESEDLTDINQWLSTHQHTVNILGIGTQEGAPIQLSNGQLLKDNSGTIVIPKLTASSLSALAMKGRGAYQTITSDNSDIENLTKENPLEQNQQGDKTLDENNFGDQWQEVGPYLLLLALPLILTYFRRGILLVLLPFSVLFAPIEKAHANWWQDLWKTKDQQGATKFQQEDYTSAAQKFNDPLWQGTSHFRAGEYEQALKAFQKVESAQSFYNQGNALAKMQQLDAAIAAYDRALELKPDHVDAKFNKELIEKLKQQQEQQSEQQQSQDQQQENQQENDQQSEDQQQSDQQQEQDSQQQQESQQQQAEQDNQQESEQQSEQQKQQQEQKDGEQQQEEMQPMQAEEQEMSDEEKQKYEQLLRKVTDDPYLLLRNKMQLEYQKRRQYRSHVGGNKKW